MAEQQYSDIPAGFQVYSDLPPGFSVGDSSEFGNVTSGHSTTAYTPPGPTAAQVSDRQAHSVVGGMVDAVEGIPGFIKNTITSLGQPEKQMENLSHMYHAYADPFEQIGRGVGEYFAPGTQPKANPDSPEWNMAARGAGAQLVSAALGAAAEPVAQAVADIPAESYQVAANKIRDIAPASGDLLDATLNAKPASSVVAAAKTGASIAGRPVASLLERIARLKAQGETPAPATPSAPLQQNPIPFNPPAETFQYEGTPTPQQHPIPMEPVDMTVPPAPQPLTPQDVVTLQQAVKPSGLAAQTWIVRNAEKVFEVAPELKGVPPGPEFQAKAVSAYNNADMAMHAAERSVPPDTLVRTKPLLDQLNALKADYALQNRADAIRMISKITDGLEEAPVMMPWDKFLQFKSGVLKGTNASNPVMRRAYGAFMKAASEVSPELSKANDAYATTRRVLEYSKIDPLTRRPLKP